MSLDPRLQGRCILVMEDDYYQADDAREVLADAGAYVLGPFGRAAAAMAAAESEKPDCAIIDLNLGDGITFEPARALVALGVPVVFITGYDTHVLPTDLASIPSLMKPVRAQQVLDAVADQLAAGKNIATTVVAPPPPR